MAVFQYLEISPNGLLREGGAALYELARMRGRGFRVAAYFGNRPPPCMAPMLVEHAMPGAQALSVDDPRVGEQGFSFSLQSATGNDRDPLRVQVGIEEILFYARTRPPMWSMAWRLLGSAQRVPGYAPLPVLYQWIIAMHQAGAKSCPQLRLELCGLASWLSPETLRFPGEKVDFVRLRQYLVRETLGLV